MCLFITLNQRGEQQHGASPRPSLNSSLLCGNLADLAGSDPKKDSIPDHHLLRFRASQHQACYLRAKASKNGGLQGQGCNSLIGCAMHHSGDNLPPSPRGGGGGEQVQSDSSCLVKLGCALQELALEVLLVHLRSQVHQHLHGSDTQSLQPCNNNIILSLA